MLAACEAIHGVLGKYAAIPAGLAPSLHSTDTVRLLLSEVAGKSIAAPPDRGAIELLGWLELPLDDAPALIVTGFNEGRVPSSLNADLFLPNRLRRALGIEDNDRRYARDAYALSLLAASREQLRLIAGKRSTDGDPMLPSRLLFACDEETAARRVKKFFAAAEKLSRTFCAKHRAPTDQRAPTGRWSAGARWSGRFGKRFLTPFLTPFPAWKSPAAAAGRPVTSMRVTEFKDYLACPYRYYLKHILKLEALADSAAELDGAAFGSLAHEVLHAFGKGSLAASADAEAIREHLGQLLDECVLQQYGKAPMPSILVQVEQLRRRLAAFAQWQAGWSPRAGGSSAWKPARKKARPRSWSMASPCSCGGGSTASTSTSPRASG